jgi:anti-sigma-K factor RskA
MKTFEERYTAWLDGALPEEEKAAFEQEHPDLGGEREQGAVLRKLLREQLSAPQLPNPDFFNSQLLARIEHEQAGIEKRKARRAWFGLPRLAWAGLGSALAAIALMVALVPQERNKDEPNDYVAEVLKTQTSQPGVKATVDAKKDVTIIKLDGLETLPPDKDLK